VVQWELSDAIGAPIRRNAPLSEYTTFRIGGPATYLCVVRSTEQVLRALLIAKKKDVRCLVLGQGSNVLIADEGFDGLVVVYRANRIEVEGTRIWTEGGTRFVRLVEVAARHGLAGLGFAAGIPGTVGGALYGNAGAYGRAIGDLLEEAVVIAADGSRRRTLRQEALGLDYRTSSLRSTGELVESLTLRLEEGDRPALWQEIEENLDHRRKRLPPPSLGSAGSFFKNLAPPSPGAHRLAAGQLLDECGCKGLRVGDAEVYEKHANIIVNRGHATAKQVVTLAMEMQRRVRERFDRQLVPEVKIMTFRRGR
jgi:UDP-N-acetylmuramate dehydrogenase